MAIVNSFDSAILFECLEPLNLGYIIKLDIHSVGLLLLSLFDVFSFLLFVLQGDEALKGNLDFFVTVGSVGSLFVAEKVRAGFFGRCNFLKLQLTKRV